MMTDKSRGLIFSIIAMALSMAHAPTFAEGQTSIISSTDHNLYLAKTLVSHMSLSEKIGQMTLVKFTMLQNTAHKIDWHKIQQYHLGAILVAGGEVPYGQGVTAGSNDPKTYLTSTQANWLRYTNAVKNHLPTITINGQTLAIPVLLGIDAVHGDQTVLGNVTFPQNIGLSMTHNPALLNKIAQWTADDIKASGFNWAYAPTVAVAHNPDWGRYFETLGAQPNWVKKDAAQMVAGLQSIRPETGEITGVLATAKHLLGDGATWDGIANTI